MHDGAHLTCGARLKEIAYISLGEARDLSLEFVGFEYGRESILNIGP